MTDFIEEYRMRVRKRLSRAESEPVVRIAEALCFPSFYAETLLRVTERRDGTTFRLFSFTSNLWYSDEGKEPTRLQETVPFPEDQADQFWTSIENLNLSSIQPDTSMRDDGMSVNALYRHEENTTRFEIRCPDPHSPHSRVMDLIYSLAWSVLKSQVSIERLEQLHGYLTDELPARGIEGDVKCLRLFGSMAS